MTYTYVKGVIILQHETPYLSLNIENPNINVKNPKKKFFRIFYIYILGQLISRRLTFIFSKTNLLFLMINVLL